jgi:hypothetical protein
MISDKIGLAQSNDLDWSLICCFHSRIRLLRIVSAPLILLMCLGIIRDWRHPAFKDMHYAGVEVEHDKDATGCSGFNPVE